MLNFQVINATNLTSEKNESEDVVVCAKQKLLELFEDADIQIVNIVKSFKTKERFELAVEGDYNEKILKALGIIFQDADGNQEISDVCDKSYLQTPEKMLAFLTGLFLGSGSLSVPCETTEKRKFYLLF